MKIKDVPRETVSPKQDHSDGFILLLMARQIKVGGKLPFIFHFQSDVL